MVVNHFRSFASHVPQEKQYQKAKPQFCGVFACLQRPCKHIKGATASEPNSDALEPVPNREPDPANKDPLKLKLSSSWTMVLQCLPWCTKIHWSKSTPNGFHHDSSCMYQRWWCTALASPSFKLHALWIVPTARKKKTQLCLRCCHCWKSLKPFSSVMATDSSPSLLHDFSKTIRIRCESFYSFVLFKFEARTLWQPSKHFPISFWQQTWGNCRAASKQRSTRAKEPTAFHFALCYLKHCQTISSQNVTDLHSSWSESAKQQSIHVAPSACFVPALLPDEAALYKSDKPATSSLPRSLAHIDFHQIASSLCKQPRRSQSPAEPVPNREPDPANKDPLKLKLSSSWTMVLQCLPWCTKIHWSKFTSKGWCTALASPSFKLHALWIVPTARKKKTQLCLRCCHCWKSLKPFSSVMATDSSPSLLHDFSKTIRIRCESFYSFVLFKFEARTLWQPSKRFPISSWLQTWGNCRAASKQRSTRAKEPTAFHFALCYLKHCQTISSQNVTDLHSSWSESAKQQSIHVAPSACFVPTLLPDEAALYKSDKPATSNLPRSLAHIDFHQIASSLCKQTRRSQSPAEPVPNREPDPANRDPLKLKLSSSWTMVLQWSTMVHEDTLIQVYSKRVSSWFILYVPALVMHSPCLSQFQIPRTLNRFNGTKNDAALPALLPLLEEFEAFQQCHGNWQFTFPSSRFFKNDPL